MVTIRSIDQIILSLIDFYRIAQPSLDLKPATVARDILVDGPSNMTALLYDELSQVSSQQSFRLVLGSDLDKLAKNFGLARKSATPSSGIALLTFSSIPSVIPINKGDLITAANGFSYAIVNGLSVLPTQLNFYKSVATKFRNDLDFVGITDQYAVQVTVQSTTSGTAGDIPKYSLSKITTAGVSNVTNVNAFSGGSDQEDDATFRNRVLSVFSGSSVGTALGYKNVALATTGVIDAFVVEPGDPLMTRDGSIVSSDSEGNLTVVSEGTGGKVDVIILGNNLAQNTDSFIYRDASNSNDPTATKNIIVLGQIAGDENKTINRRRIDNIAAGTLPAQPVNSITQVSGSGSGPNFQPKSIDSFGRVTGNYEIIADQGSFGGSPFGFDSFHWIDNKISLFNEDRVKGKFCGQDTTTYPDVLEIPNVQQNISITNENSNVLTSDRSLIQLLHAPATAVTRVFNVNTGERYLIANQNPNGTGSTNASGVIKISGNTLPSPSDILQVDYTWIVSFDQYVDYDGKSLTDNPRSAVDSIDWGYSNLVRSEYVSFARNNSNTFFTGSVSLPVNAVVSASTFQEIDGYVSTVTSGVFTGRLSVVITNTIDSISSIDNVYFKNTFTELYKTAQADGSFSVAAVVVGINIRYVTTIILPTDTKATIGDHVTCITNSNDIYNTSNSNGSFSNTQITIPVANLSTAANNFNLKVTYINNTQNIINVGTTSIPFSRRGNGFVINNSNGFNNTFISNVSRKEHQVIQLNTSNQLYVELGLLSTDATLNVSDIVSVIRLSDKQELWNNDFPGTIGTGTSGNYQLFFSGLHTPATGDQVLVIYFATDLQRFQPFTFKNAIFEKDFANLQYNVVTNQFSVPIHSFITESAITFQILEPNTDIILASATNGQLTSNGNAISASFFSSSINFNNVLDGYGNAVNILAKKIRLINCANINNSNTYDITDFNSLTNVLTISNDFSQISRKQLSITRISDGKELWSTAGEIDVINNELRFPASTNLASPLDDVIVTYYIGSNIKQVNTKLSLNVTDQINNTGVMSVLGTTITRAKDIVFNTATSGLKQNLTEAIRKALGLNSNVSVPSNIKLVKIAKLERVTTTNSTSDDVLLSNATYDVFNTTINDNTFFSNSTIENQSLENFDFILPSTQNNIANLVSQVSSGDKFRVTFYYSTSNDLENINFTRNGTLYTNKLFAIIDKVYISSGFNASQSAKLTVSNFNQPITGSRYKVFYDYTAPKPNERIIIKYNYNKLISDTTFNIETSRPINADVLVKQASSILLDVTMNIVVSTLFASSAELIKQNVKDKLIASINANGLGTLIDSSSLITAAFAVEGVAGARIIFFNRNGKIGQVLKIQAHSNEYFVANNIIVNQETR